MAQIPVKFCKKYEEEEDWTEYTMTESETYFQPDYHTVKENFRACSVYPNYQEVVRTERIELNSNIIDEPYTSFDHYLGTQFWLLREDFLLPLRKAVQERKKWSHSEYDLSNRKNHDKVKFVRPASEQLNQMKGTTLLCFDPGRNWFRLEENIERSKMFMLGSLLCFTCNSFKTLLFATVISRDLKYLSKAQILVKFCENYEEDIYWTEYTMIESEAYFQPYYHVLTALQDISDNFPFQEYLVHVKNEDSLPRYLKRNENPVVISVKGAQKDYTFDVVDLDNWPSAAELGLDDSQFQALKAALTRELAVIHGPPGTGKTFLALKIIEILTRNKQAMNRKTPIMVISNTNCALDQLLVAALKITPKLVRVGGQSRRQELEDFNFNKFKGSRYQRLQRLAQQDVVGLTTTGAARMRSELNELGCEVVIVEEAAAVFEAHVIACISNKCQHLIMTGDHKQLRPQVSSKSLENLKLDISLFERMVVSREENYCMLDVQYRMPPEMVELISPLFYKDLKNDESVHQKPDLRILTKRVSFVTHNFQEGDDLYKAKSKQQNLGKMNKHEAEFVIALCNYLLVKRGYSPYEVTILTAYNEQVLAIKKLIAKNKSEYGKELPKVKVAAVDDFQGGECSIVILSMVRSNHNGDIGFLDLPNRVSAALSKARDGLVMVGNMTTLCARSHLWQSIHHSLRMQGAVGHSLILSCAEHPKNQIAVQRPEDFDRLCPNGDCSQQCMKIMYCGHSCKSLYRPNCDHSSYSCKEPCLRKCKAGIHRCPLACHESCASKCEVEVNVIFSCGLHKTVMPCWQRSLQAAIIDCTVTTTKIFPGCLHSSLLVCGQPEVCSNPCDRPLRCGHLCKQNCHFDQLEEIHRHAVCSQRVPAMGSCGHYVEKVCSADAAPIKCNECRKKPNCVIS